MEVEDDKPIKAANSANICFDAHTPKDGFEKWHHDLLALSRVSAAVSGLRDLDAILKIGLDSVLNIVNGTVGGALLLDEKNRILSYRVYRGLSTKYAEEMRLKLGEGIAGRVAQNGKSIMLEDISKDPRVARPDLVGVEGLKAFISVPLRAEDNILGVLNVASHMPHHFTKDDVYLLHSIGDQLGIAIEQAKLCEQLSRERERYRQLARHILVAQEEERKRISRELHDETSQSLAGLALILQALVDMTEMSDSYDSEFIDRLKKAHSLAVGISTEVGKVIVNLRPTLLDTLGLVPAIRNYAETILRPLGIDVSLETKGISRPLSPGVEVGLFRVAQSAIGNIARHSGAKTTTITIETGANDLALYISDDGKGFDVSEIVGVEENGRGRGLFSMKERVGLLGGTCSVKSQFNHGTIVTAMVPITQGKVNAEDKSTSGR